MPGIGQIPFCALAGHHVLSAGKIEWCLFSSQGCKPGIRLDFVHWCTPSTLHRAWHLVDPWETFNQHQEAQRADPELQRLLEAASTTSCWKLLHALGLQEDTVGQRVGPEGEARVFSQSGATPRAPWAGPVCLGLSSPASRRDPVALGVAGISPLGLPGCTAPKVTCLMSWPDQHSWWPQPGPGR